MEYSSFGIIFVLSIVLSFSSTLAQQPIPDACNEHPDDYWFCNSNQGCLCIINIKRSTTSFSQDLDHSGSFIISNVDDKLALNLDGATLAEGQGIISYPQFANSAKNQQWEANEELFIRLLTGSTKYFRLHSAIADRKGASFLAVEESANSELHLGKFKNLPNQLWAIRLVPHSVPPKSYIQNYKSGKVMCSVGYIKKVALRRTLTDPKCWWRILPLPKTPVPINPKP